MNPTELLGRIALQHDALIDRDHSLLCVRLAWRPLPGQAEPDMAALMAAFGEHLLQVPAPVALPVRGMADLDVLQSLDLPEGLWIEFPAALSAAPQATDALLHLQSGGAPLLCRGRPPQDSPLGPRIALYIDQEGERRVHENTTSLVQLESALTGGAAATLGWPTRGATIASGKRDNEATLQVLFDVIQRIDREDALDSLAAVLDSSPTLAFRLLGLLNSAACGLRSEMTSVRHAIMMLGYRKLRQWISLLLASAVETPRTRPLMEASLRRAFLMQELAMRLGESGDRGDMFICGMFSMLDQMLGKPMLELLRTVPLPGEVTECLAHDRGPLKPYLDLARQIESNVAFDLEAACEATATTPAEVNMAVLKSLVQAATVGGRAPTSSAAAHAIALGGT